MNADRSGILDPGELGRLIRAARTRLDLSVAELADRCAARGVAASVRTLYRIERGEILPDAEQLFTLFAEVVPPEGATLIGFFGPALEPGIRREVAEAVRRARDADTG